MCVWGGILKQNCDLNIFGIECVQIGIAKRDSKDAGLVNYFSDFDAKKGVSNRFKNSKVLRVVNFSREKAVF